MGFSETEKKLLLEAKFVGPTVVQRLEEVGINNFKELSEYTAEEVTNIVSSKLKSTCWQNSPQAKKAVKNAIMTALNNL